MSLEHCAAIAEMSAKAFAKCMEEIEIPSFVFESDAELKEKLELDYADVLAGRVKPAKETFEEIRKRMLSYFSAVTTEGVQSILAMFYMSSARKGDFLLLGLLLLLLIINQAAINNK